MYYRADWFKEAGLQPPKTFDDFQNAAIKLTDPSKNRFGFGMRGAGGGEGLLIEVMRSFGSPIVDDKGQPAMDKPEGNGRRPLVQRVVHEISRGAAECHERQLSADHDRLYHRADSHAVAPHRLAHRRQHRPRRRHAANSAHCHDRWDQPRTSPT